MFKWIEKAPPSLLKWLYIVCLPSKLEGPYEKKDILSVKKVRKMKQIKKFQNKK